jgi:hypothetical protein
MATENLGFRLICACGVMRGRGEGSSLSTLLLVNAMLKKSVHVLVDSDQFWSD